MPSLVLVALVCCGLTFGEEITSELERALQTGRRAHQLPPATLCNDATFLRRAMLDVLGRLPTPAELSTFFADRGVDKRGRLVDRLLDDPRFADRYGLLWADLLRIKAEFPSNLWPLAAQAYDAWVRQALRDGMPYDQFVTALLVTSGSNFRAPPVNFFRSCPERSAEAYAAHAARLFLGQSLKQPGGDSAGFIACFARIGFKTTDEWKEEVVFCLPDDRSGPQPAYAGLDGRLLTCAAEEDPRRVVATWITSPDNPWFARAYCNRVWSWLLGRGFHEKVDDLQGEPWSAELLDTLAQAFRESHWDQRQVFRLILNSSAYQALAGPAEAPEAGFTTYPLRRLDAEVLLDAINQILNGHERYVSAIPEPFTYLPNDQRATSLADGSITLPFLTLFGRPPRNTDASDERQNELNIEQVRHLLNASHIQDKLNTSPTLKRLSTPRKDAPPNPALITDVLYMLFLSRRPEADERDLALAVFSNPELSPADATIDLAWALLNTSEFIIRH